MSIQKKMLCFPGYKYISLDHTLWVGKLYTLRRMDHLDSLPHTGRSVYKLVDEVWRDDTKWHIEQIACSKHLGHTFKRASCTSAT